MVEKLIMSEDLEMLDESNRILPSPPRPWVRFWARTLDYYTFVFVLGLIWEFMFPGFLEQIRSILLSLLYALVWLIVEGLFLTLFGTTLGKWIFGISIFNENGERLTPVQSFRRSLLVWWRGTGIGIGLPKLIAAILGHSRLVREGITTWDRDMELVVVHGKIVLLRWLVAGILIVIPFGLMLIGYFVERY
ncbi:RDD family protein [Paenibacillus filicis]|uniref:RDD family protein n=1 Tax=Paenibacillus filicis TaxID=669464 RepID=A0ABU9DFQ2_9BACL